jgi:hypothetical protein
VAHGSSFHKNHMACKDFVNEKIQKCTVFKMGTFWYESPRSLAQAYWHLWGTCWCHHHGNILVMVATGSSGTAECFCQITCHITDDSHLQSLPKEPELSRTVFQTSHVFLPCQWVYIIVLYGKTFKTPTPSAKCSRNVCFLEYYAHSTNTQMNI